MASKSILRKRRVLLLLPLLLLLTARELVLTWSPAVFFALAVLPPFTIMWIESKSQTSPRLAACTKHFLRVHIFECGAVFRNHCFGERFGPEICHVFLTLDSAHYKLLDLTSSCIHKYATSMCFNQPLPCLWRMCSVACGLRISGQHWLHLVTQILQQRHNSFSNVPNAAAYSAAPAPRLAMIFCVCMLSGCDCRAAPRLRLMIFEFLCSLPKLNLKMSSLLRPLKIRLHCLSRFKKGSVPWSLTSFDQTRAR